MLRISLTLCSLRKARLSTIQMLLKQGLFAIATTRPIAVKSVATAATHLAAFAFFYYKYYFG